MTLTPTPSQTVGPYYAIGLCRRTENELADPSAVGSRHLTGRLLDGAGEPIPDGVIELWDPEGGWGRSGTDPEGRFSFVITKPAARPGEAPHFNVLVFARGLLRHQLTRVYFPDEKDANAADPALVGLGDQQRSTLVAADEDGALRFDIRMQGEGRTVFFAT